MDIITWISEATKQLIETGIASARLDAELILAETLRRPRTYLHAHPDEALDPRRRDIADARLSLRLDRVPLAYILGYKEFYGRKFAVSPAVLVPRPESEAMISLLLELCPTDTAPKTLIDIGTGSGCLGITAALERPNLRVILSDISPRALKIAKKNAANLGAEVKVQRQSLLNGQIEPLDYIFANLPYVDRTWDVSPELRHEPEEALFAENGGLMLINTLIAQIPHHITPGGLIFIEADPRQHTKLITLAQTQQLALIKQHHYILVLRFVGTKR